MRKHCVCCSGIGVHTNLSRCDAACKLNLKNSERDGHKFV